MHITISIISFSFVQNRRVGGVQARPSSPPARARLETTGGGAEQHEAQVVFARHFRVLYVNALTRVHM